MNTTLYPERFPEWEARCWAAYHNPDPHELERFQIETLYLPPAQRHSIFYHTARRALGACDALVGMAP